MKKCPKCGSTMSCGAPHSDGDAYNMNVIIVDILRVSQVGTMKNNQSFKKDAARHLVDYCYTFERR